MSAEAVWDALAEIPDPEIPVISIVDLGVVRDVRVDGDRVHVDFTPNDTNNYEMKAKDVWITVNKGNQVITFAALPNRTFGDPSISITATGGGSGVAVMFSSVWVRLSPA